jgi:ATP-dependent DNA ligase
VYSRPGRDVTADLPQLGALHGAVPAGTVLDGELVSGSGGSSSFYQLSPHLSARRASVTFAAFDLLALGGRSLIYAPYRERRHLLDDLCLLGLRGAPCLSGPTSRCQTSWPPANSRPHRGPGGEAGPLEVLASVVAAQTG